MHREKKTQIMGVLNVTPDSFSDGGRFADSDDAVAHALQMLADGADIIDVGGESTRPGAPAVDVATELERTIGVIAEIHAAAPAAVISIDTTKAEVARAAVLAGATIVNDISGLGFDPKMAALVAETEVRLVLMHIQGTPETMQAEPTYGDVVEDVAAFLEQRIALAVAAGVQRDKIVVDPGIGFGKTLAHNLELLRRLDELTRLGPVLVGTSRKSFIGALTGKSVEERGYGTAATVALAVAAGASIVRVHDVAAMRDVVTVAEAVCAT